MKNHIYELTLCLGMLFCIPLAGMSQDTLSYSDPDLPKHIQNSKRQGRTQYVKGIDASKYTGTWEAETNGYVCKIVFVPYIHTVNTTTRERLLGKYRLAKGDTVIVNNIGLPERPDFCIIGWERIAGLYLYLSDSDIVGELQLLNPISADSARITCWKTEVVRMGQATQQLSPKEKTQAALLKFFSPGIVFTKLNTLTE